MKIPAKPENEAERLASLASFQILDTFPEDVFDEITHYAASRFNVSTALISLVDANRQWFKSCVGLEGVSQTERDVSFCAHAILDDKPFIVPDALADIRFADNPLVVGQPYIRFYAGAPLITTEGHRIGTLCLFDQKPRSLSASEEAELVELARRVMIRLKLRLARLSLQAAIKELNRV